LIIYFTAKVKYNRQEYSGIEDEVSRRPSVLQ